MAITRAQQAKQMLQDGGRTGLRGGGADMGTVAGETRAANEDLAEKARQEQKQTDKLNERIARNRKERERQKLKQELLMTPVGRNRPLGPISLMNARFQRNMDINLAKKRAEDLYNRLETYVVGDTDIDYDFSDAPKGLETLTSNRGTSIESTRPNLSTVNPNVNLSVLGSILDKTRPDTQVTLKNTLDKARDYRDLVNKSSTMTNQEIKDSLTELQNRGKTSDQINPPDTGGGVNQIIPVDTTFAQAPVEEEEDYYGGKNPFDINRVAFRLMADGGAVMDDEPRQAYGLGSIVKKATRAVKKIAKSPVGKIALAYGAYKLGGLKFGEGDGLSLFQRFSDLTGPQKALLGIGATSALAGFMTPKEEEEEEDFRGEGLDIPLYRRNPEGFLAPRFRAEGGSINEKEKEPVAKKVMPLIDMGGKEKDYRETGGFVDMGRMEKADDVPARLSKNEFVFTADAVRNAGDGSVDKGAEVMYNMMKNLEAGGEVSEESQGLEGARKMFQTSQRLEEVL